MKKKITSTLTCLIALTALATAPAYANPQPAPVSSISSTQTNSYNLRPGDELEITVFNHPELSSNPNGTSQYIVRPDGGLSFPLLGTINVTGLSVEQLQQKLTTGFGQYLRNPNVAINIKQLGTTRVYVLGQIAQAGLYELTKSHRAIDAISAAKGFTEKSAKKKVLLIRRGSNTPILLNINDYLEKGDQSQNPELHEGDTLYFSSNGKVNIIRDIIPYVNAAYYIKKFND